MSKDKILVIEDNPMFAKMVNHDLSKEGYEVTVVGSGGDMFQAVDKQAYDCLILDLGLPDEDGIVLLRKMRARSDVQPIIVLTGTPASLSALTTFPICGIVVVSKAETATMSAFSLLAFSTKVSAAMSMPMSTTLKPPPLSIMPTRFLPISWRSPRAVPIITTPWGLAPLSASSGSNSSIAEFIARAAIKTSGT